MAQDQFPVTVIWKQETLEGDDLLSQDDALVMLSVLIAIIRGITLLIAPTMLCFVEFQEVI